MEVIQVAIEFVAVCAYFTKARGLFGIKNRLKIPQKLTWKLIFEA